MIRLFVIAGVIVLLMAVVTLLQRLMTSPQGRGDFPFERIDPLLTPAERSFFGVLMQVVGNRYVVMSKVRLADILKPQAGLSPSEHTTAQNRISSKHVDFVLCDPASLSVVAVIELDDKSHATDRRKLRDGFLDRALAAAGVPIMHVRAQRSYQADEIRGAVAALVAGQ